MSITNRLSAFLLMLLGLVLGGFSFSLYGLARWHLQLQADRHLEAAMHGLLGAVEVHSSDVEWEPKERRLPVGADTDLTAVRWLLNDEHGKLVDFSSNLNDVDLRQVLAGDPNWRVLRRRLRAGSFETEDITDRAAGASISAEDLPSDRSAIRQSFVITVGLSRKPISTTLNKLALALSCISLTIWSVAGATGHWLCRRAIAPMTRMAEQARSLQKSPQNHTPLHVPATNDEVAELGVAYNELLRSLWTSLAQQQRFTGDASHQLRTPLSAILSAVEVTLRQPRTPLEYSHALTVVLQRGRDLQGIVESLLMLTRHDSPEALRSRALLELNAWCRDRVESWRNHERYQDIRLTLPAEILWVKAQPALLNQLHDNLLDNAFKYSDPGTPVAIELSERNGDACLEIRDRGKGISTTDAQHIFEPFFRSSDARWKGISGTGLGLAIAQQIAASLGGQLRLASNSDQGSCFSFSLQREIAPVSETEASGLAAPRDPRV